MSDPGLLPCNSARRRPSPFGPKEHGAGDQERGRQKLANPRAEMVHRTVRTSPYPKLRRGEVRPKPVLPTRRSGISVEPQGACWPIKEASPPSETGEEPLVQAQGLLQRTCSKSRKPATRSRKEGLPSHAGVLVYRRNYFHSVPGALGPLPPPASHLRHRWHDGHPFPGLRPRNRFHFLSYRHTHCFQKINKRYPQMSSFHQNEKDFRGQSGRKWWAWAVVRWEREGGASEAALQR